MTHQIIFFTENNCGQLGLGDENPRRGPTFLALLSKETIVHAATGKAHSLSVAESGAVFACGCNKFGAVGSTPPKKHETAPKPVPVPGVTSVVRVSAGADFSLALTGTGTVYSFGWSEFGQLGHGTDGSYNKAEGTIKITYEAERTPSVVAGLSKIAQIACGSHHACALQADVSLEVELASDACSLSFCVYVCLPACLPACLPVSPIHDLVKPVLLAMALILVIVPCALCDEIASVACSSICSVPSIVPFS